VAGLQRLAHSITEPRYFLKLCGTAEELQASLPGGWELHAQRYFMQARAVPLERRLTEEYRIEIKHDGMVWQARIFSKTGALAASGYAAETREAFVYDRIVTEPQHRRKGLGHALMKNLGAAKRHSQIPELLVATEEGMALYSSIGWETISLYSTASIAMP
jgi:predicted acetyltransferase